MITVNLFMESMDPLLKYCEIAVPNICELDEEGFAMARRDGIGASDSAAVLGTMEKFRTADDVLLNKLETKYTDEEKAIGNKPNVKKGKDLEVLNLLKAEGKLGLDIAKPSHMYRLKEFPFLTINYDGIVKIEEELIPVEAKFVSTYADKYYNFEELDKAAMPAPAPGIGTVPENIEYYSKYHGIPGYYMVQVQHQLLGTGASYAYLAVIRDKTWEHYMFKIPRYGWMQNAIATIGYTFWNKVLRARKAK